VSNVLLSGILRALDVAVLEREPRGVFNLVAVPPAWLRGAFTEVLMARSPSLSGALPFLDSFMPEAERGWREGGQTIVESGLFTATIAGHEILLRARALTIGGRALVILERLTGESDARPILQMARENVLEYQRLVRETQALHAPAAAIGDELGRLQATVVAPEQQRLVDALSDANRRLMSALDRLPKPLPGAEARSEKLMPPEPPAAKGAP
jgi:hypothetical protein